MRVEQPKVGKDVDSWCTRCKLMLAHTVEAVAGNKITRVHCNTCRTQHAYRPSPPREGGATGTVRRPGPARASRATAALSKGPDYTALLRGRDAANARKYSVHERFAQKDVMTHPTFGVGIVYAVKEASKIDVLFPDGMRTLVHGR